MQPLVQSGVGLSAAPSLKGRTRVMVKRALDLTVSISLLLFLSPLMTVIAAAIKLDSQGGVLFKQQRLGKGGRPFMILKFRSMYVGADHSVHRQAVRNFAAGRPVSFVNGKPWFKLSQDPRVTRVGRLLRATGLDELPQLINVIRGDMSLVGPRPAIPYELEFYKDWHHQRFAVRPGISGLWQVKRNGATSLDDMVKQDIEYIRSFSIRLDLKIMLATIPKVVLRGWAL